MQAENPQNVVEDQSLELSQCRDYQMIQLIQSTIPARQTFKGMSQTYRKLAQLPNLTPSERGEMLDLGQRMINLRTELQPINNLRGLLLEQNSGLVRHYAIRYQYWMPIDDLVQHGGIGFLRAIDLFDTTREDGKLLPYVCRGIRLSIERAIENEALMIRLPANLHWQGGVVSETKAKLEDEMGESGPTVEELAELAQISCDEVETIQKAEVISWEQEEEKKGRNRRMFDYIEQFVRMEDVVDEIDLRDRLRTIFIQVDITPRQQQILMLRFVDGYSLEKVAEKIGAKSHAAVRYQEQLALAKLRQHSDIDSLRNFIAPQPNGPEYPKAGRKKKDLS